MQKSSSRLRLQTLVRLRWIAIAGQVSALLGVHFGLGFALPVVQALAVVMLSAALNVFLLLRYPARHRLSVRFGTELLVYDMLQLAALLYLTGGIANPFAFLLVAPVTVAAATLPLESTLLISVVTLAVAAVLARYHLPLPWRPGEALAIPTLYKAGIWASILCSVAFMGLYARRLAREARQMSDALAATEAVLAREQKLHALDGLAAAAAHELGTPLGTITVVAKELERSLAPDSPMREDILLLRSQALRCRDILQTLASKSREKDPLHTRLPLTHLIEEAVEPYRVFEKDIQIAAGPVAGLDEAAVREPIAERRPGLTHGLANIVENAVDFARGRVEIEAGWSGERVFITVADDGPGFPPAILGSLGDPYVTTRGAAGAPRSDGREAAGGLGLGFFIAKTLLERSGAEIELSNRAAPASGALVQITWPRATFEQKLGPQDD